MNNEIYKNVYKFKFSLLILSDATYNFEILFIAMIHY